MELKKTLKKENRYLNNQEGFTLIEIIAVLVILSILAVVAVPKYFDLQTEAQAKAMKAAMAEAIGRVNGHFAEQLLSNVAPENIVYTTSTIGSDLGDFTLSVDSITITVDGEEQPGLRLTVSPNEGTAVQNAPDEVREIPIPGLPTG